ncbi:toxic anion resistance protein [Lactococcus termiticola]|uniref:Tellurite resistance protein n=1 Tax=Lactococcus termiticola TaxID=2169526 RepID=A0A2R5HKE5_9LACT|nr:toxic anion resistance protein [Lactococcus termiticola]GBG97278.1 hypothetical protein NtB2_01417 [Lactococcus termiticola]
MTDAFNIDGIIAESLETKNEVQETSEVKSQEGTNFLTSLPAETQLKIKNETPALANKFVEDENYLLEFGTQAVENVNRLVNRILDEQRKIQLPEIDDILRNANRDLKGFSTKYGEIKQADLDKEPGLLEKLFRGGKSKLNDLYFDAKNVEEKMDVLAADIVKQEDQLSKNIISGQMLVEENNKSIEPLIGVIALIESSQLELGSRAEKLKAKLDGANNTSPETAAHQDELTRVTDVINRLEQRHTEFLGRLYVAWANTPAMRNLIKTSSDLKSKLSLVRLNTLPTMKLTIAQLGFLQQANATNKVASSIDKANNDALQMLSATSEKVIPEIERTVQNPSLTVETVVKMANSIVEQNSALIDAISDGRMKRKEVEDAMVQNAQIITDSSKLKDEKIISVITEKAKLLDEN